MAGIVRIDDEVITTDDFLRTLKLTGQFEGLVEQVVRDRLAVLADEPEAFGEMAREHSIGDTRERDGLIGKVMRGALKPDIEARVFNARPGELLGPFPAPDRSFYEIFCVNAKHPATLDADTAAEVRRLLREQWLMARAQEH